MTLALLGLVVSRFVPAIASAELTHVTMWGEYGFGPDQLNYPTGIALGPNGDVYVTDGGNDRVTRFTPDGDYVDTIAGPWGIHVDSAGSVYVISQGQERIQKFTENGVFLMQWGVEGPLPGQFMKPRSVTTDDQGNIYVSDVQRHDVQKFNSTAEYLLEWGEPGSLPGQFLHPYHLSYADGKIVVVDWLEHPHGGRLTSFTTMGVLSEVLVDGPQGIGELEFNTIWAAAYDGATDWYVVEWENHRVQKLREEAVDAAISTPLYTSVLGAPLPNPSSGPVRFQLNLPSGASGHFMLDILDLGGRRIFSQPLQASLLSPSELIWNGMDQEGRPAAPGVYFATLRGIGLDCRQKVIRIDR